MILPSQSLSTPRGVATNLTFVDLRKAFGGCTVEGVNEYNAVNGAYDYIDQ
jgi:hypothetical protein